MYSTYLAGTDAPFNGSAEGRGIAVDASGNAYITGATTSTVGTLHAIVGPSLTNQGGNVTATDAFVGKLNAAGSAFVYLGVASISAERQGR